jgi:3-deoxy-manno-octulosonate cytidylyltransferase (CMP-KDO synthetase)
VAAQKPIVLIPARLAATRLPDKPLADIRGAPMIVHVWRRAMEAQCGPVIVAAGEPAIAEAVERAGGRAILTGAHHPSGTDRIFEALGKADPAGAHDVIVNLQGDLPAIDPADLRAVLTPLADPAVDIATLVAECREDYERREPSVVKCVTAFAPGQRIARALYFSRAQVPSGDGPLYHHIGLYAFRREALARFVSLPPSPLEKRERLEQLRALEAGMRIDAALVDKVPFGVDTPADLDRARALLAPTKGK